MERGVSNVSMYGAMVGFRGKVVTGDAGCGMRDAGYRMRERDGFTANRWWLGNNKEVGEVRSG